MQISVIDAGTMGDGIAKVSAQAGHDGQLRAVDEEILDAARPKIDRTLTEGNSR